MRTLRVVAIGAAILGLPIVGLFAYGSWVNAHMMYPSLKNESAFLRAYDPKSVVRQFIYQHESYGEGDGSGGGAGTKFVMHDSHFDEHFTMRTDQKDPLMVAVGHDASQELTLNGAQILSQSGTPSTGFHFQYAIGNSIGSISIDPPAPGTVHRNMPLPDGFEDVSLNIDVREHWFPKGIPPETAQLSPETER